MIQEKTTPRLLPLALAAILSFSAAAAHKKAGKIQEADRAVIENAPAVLWREPVDIASRNLLYGRGGKEHEPQGEFVFVKEDLKGSNPKFVVRDQGGVNWKVKLGPEARPETAASRLVWAVGYLTNEDYLVPVLRVRNMPARLQRGQDLIEPDGSMVDARLKRYLEGEEKTANWQWRVNPFTGTRELNGLRVMMALINNWDLKDSNNSVYDEKARPEGPERIYIVSDLGATFGTPRRDWPVIKAKGNLEEYNRSQFIRQITPEFVDFDTPGRPSIYIAVSPRSYFGRMKFTWIGRQIPRADARWIGELLARLSPDQIRDAFRAAGYGPGDVEGFARVVEHRIAQLKDL